MGSLGVSGSFLQMGSLGVPGSFWGLDPLAFWDPVSNHGVAIAGLRDLFGGFFGAFLGIRLGAFSRGRIGGLFGRGGGRIWRLRLGLGGAGRR